MKIKTDLHAGMTYDECVTQRDWWKNQAQMMETYYHNKSNYPPAGLWFPCQGQVSPPPPPNQGGGWVDGQWVPDMSGWC